DFAITGPDGAFLVRDLPAGPVEISAADVTQHVDPVMKVVKSIVVGGPATLIDLGEIPVDD
ncbi:MAG: hypothetical protein NT062_28925, partial [Proteobacteria bacterium]|nr:hypothetical protein [Pseudomonadota bacterium]